MNHILHQNTAPNDPQLSPPSSSLESKISPSVLLIIVILALIFFISGLLHLLLRCLLRPTNRDPEDSDLNATVLQGQLRQLFHLHDSGVDQSFIDTLPVFLYKAIIGLKDPFDCAVCLCEFEPEDKLRLLPKCSHAFHIECIDTWLLSHSTCPLCRSSLIAPELMSPSCSPVVLVLESGNESYREIGADSESNAHVGFLPEEDLGPSITENSTKLGDVADLASVDSMPVETKVVQVKLGNFRNADASSTSVVGDQCEGTSNANLDQRRCFSMGSYEYVMNETSLLQVSIKPSKKKPSRFKKPGYAMSECDCQSRREGFKGFDSSKSLQSVEDNGSSARLSSGKKESFSVSKIWLRQKKDKPIGEGSSSRRAFSFRLPMRNESAKAKACVSPRTLSEFEVSGWEKSVSEMELDVEAGSCNNSIVSLGSQIEEAPSFARRTLLWIVGRQNKVGSHNLSRIANNL